MATAQCNEITPMLGAYEDGELGGAEQLEVTRHLAGCALCKTEMAATATISVAETCLAAKRAARVLSR